MSSHDGQSAYREGWRENPVRENFHKRPHVQGEWEMQMRTLVLLVLSQACPFQDWASDNWYHGPAMAEGWEAPRLPIVPAKGSDKWLWTRDETSSVPAANYR